MILTISARGIAMESPQPQRLVLPFWDGDQRKPDESVKNRQRRRGLEMDSPTGGGVKASIYQRFRYRRRTRPPEAQVPNRA